MTDATYGPVQGKYGVAVPVPVPPTPDHALLLMHWLIDAPGYNHSRRQYILAVVLTADTPGFHPLRLPFPEATHQISIIPLNPEAGQLSPHSLVRRLLAHEVPFIGDDAIRVYVTATHEEMHTLIPMLAAAITCHGWSPDVTVNPAEVRGAWREGIERDLMILRSNPPQPPPQPVRVPLPPQAITPGAMTPPGGHRPDDNSQAHLVPSFHPVHRG